ncbi:hypothetical protein MMC10_004269 [Thelotrema lepadinum]|nr:hypothetical protein [Thelotrema lepadinum]
MAMPPLKSTTGQPIKYTVEHYRKDGVSSEAFMDWFTNVVLPKAMPVMKKHNVLKVAVHRTDHKVGPAFQGVVDQVRPGWKVSDCDFVLEHWVYDLESIVKLSSDPEWFGEVLKDGEDWLDTSRSNIYIGYDTTYLEDGAIKNLPQN